MRSEYHRSPHWVRPGADQSRRPKFHAVVFSQFTSFLDLVQEGLKTAKLRSVRLDGTMSRKEREASVRQFNDKSRHCVFVISLKAGGTGLNLVRCKQYRRKATDLMCLADVS